MRSNGKPVVTAVAAMALLASFVTSAAARNFSLSNRNIRVVFEPLTTVNSMPTIRCRLTLEGSFHCATISKVANALLGYISRASFDQPTCRDATGSEAFEVVQTSLPWHIRYVSFSGTLPRVKLRIKFNEISFTLLNVPLIGTCRYTGSADLIVTGPAGGEITEGNAAMAMEEGSLIPTETFGCNSMKWGTLPTPVTLLGTTIGVRIRLT
jgi:hypothetical protein